MCYFSATAAVVEGRSKECEEPLLHSKEGGGLVVLGLPFGTDRRIAGSLTANNCVKSAK